MSANQGGAARAASRLRAALLAGAACVSGLVAAGEARARDAEVTEVIVTARKRQESILNVPVIETAISQDQLERMQTNDLQDVVKLAPGLSLGESLLSIGAQVSLRGVGTSSLAVGVEQSVSLNIDGLQLTQGLAYQSGIFDVGQIEVLKGPQSLFYGKSSPGGVISIRTADPTNAFEVVARAGYEFEALEQRGELIVSGPVTDTVKLRLAGMYSDERGFFTNAATALAGTGALSPTKSRVPATKTFILRGTALWNPTDRFDARLKLNFTEDKSLYAGSGQYVSCPDGTGVPPGLPFAPFIGGGEDCKRDRTLRIVAYDPAAFPGVENDGVPHLDATQKFGALELNYRLLPNLVLTSATGYYLIRSSSLVNTTNTTFAAPPFTFSNRFRRRDFTEEVRLSSDFAAPLNFTLGAFYQDGQFSNQVTLRGNTAYLFPPLLSRGVHVVDIKSYSVFGQLRWRVVPAVEVALGARWADEKRRDNPVDLLGAPTPVLLATPRIKADNLSPELTVTYRPTDTLTVFGALKRGYKSGSFNTAVPAAPGDSNAFGDEKVEGGEVGLKTRLFNRRLALDVAAYDYRYTGLQVGATEPPEAGQLPIERTVNAGSALVYGVEMDAAYRPPRVEGLTLNLSANWNRARFKTLDNVPCWGGQTVAEGCNRTLNPNTGLFLTQDLAGHPLVRAPNWQVNFGFDYERPVGYGLTLVVANNNQYSSKYPANLSNRRDIYQRAYMKNDLSLALRGPRDRWEVAVIGKNLGNRLTSGNCPSYNAAGATLGGLVTGGAVRGPAGVDEVACFLDRGREVWLRLTLRPTN